MRSRFHSSALPNGVNTMHGSIVPVMGSILVPPSRSGIPILPPRGGGLHHPRPPRDGGRCGRGVCRPLALDSCLLCGENFPYPIQSIASLGYIAYPPIRDASFLFIRPPPQNLRRCFLYLHAPIFLNSTFCGPSPPPVWINVVCCNVLRSFRLLTVRRFQLKLWSIPDLRCLRTIRHPAEILPVSWTRLNFFRS